MLHRGRFSNREKNLGKEGKESWRRKWSWKVSIAELGGHEPRFQAERAREAAMPFKPRRGSINFSQPRIPIYNYMPLISATERKGFSMKRMKEGNGKGG